MAPEAQRRTVQPGAEHKRFLHFWSMKGIFASENALALDSLDGSGASHFQVVAQHGSSRRLLRPIAGHLCGSKPDRKDPPRIWETHLVGAVG